MNDPLWWTVMGALILAYACGWASGWISRGMFERQQAGDKAIRELEQLKRKMQDAQH